MGDDRIKPVILIAEMDMVHRENLKWRLVSRGFQAVEAYDMPNAFWSLYCRSPDLVIIGSSAQTAQDGLKVAEEIRERDKTVPLILIVQHSSEERVLSALKIAVNDYFKQPFSFEELVASIRGMLSHASPRSPQRIKKNLSDLSQVEPLIGKSQPMREIKAHLLKIATTGSTVASGVATPPQPASSAADARTSKPATMRLFLIRIPPP